ncbi:MAG: zinc-binding dehydrogenase [Candidatus Dormibacteraeota bacterium]|nr:zinc-binding dehydrogenase [Candidatus Dormibacteraeota bacterium]
MRAAVIEQYGNPPVVREMPPPPAADGATLIEVLAAPLNPVDLSIANRRFYGDSPKIPYVPGREGVGRVLKGSSMQPGTRVYFEVDGPHGSLAEQSATSPIHLAEVPSGVSDAAAACLGIAALAAWLALEWRAMLRQGETVLVLGASGALGMIAVQAARLLQAGRVIAAARSAEGLKKATGLGADVTVPLPGDDGLTERFKEAAGGPIDVVIDPLWGPPGLAAMKALRVGGRHVQLGQAAGAEIDLPSSVVRGKQLTILGHTNFAVPWEVKARAFQTMAVHALAGRLRVEYETLPLEETPQAWQRQASSPGRKLVLLP